MDENYFGTSAKGKVKWEIVEGTNNIVPPEGLMIPSTVIEDLPIKIDSSLNDIELDFSYQLIRSINTGTTDIVLTSFVNMPKYTCNRSVIVRNDRLTALVLTPRTVDLADGDTIYSFVNMSTPTIEIPSGKSAEFNYSIIELETNLFEVRLAVNKQN